ncbi:S8 family serine peptidase [Streptomyces sp. 3MP-14]|uniref:S8 family serine peptidase n=1 Tax=Streptomyces mimosae TaxID=2586635 RepID=A0A5N6A261_9ACTN|nr:MULTISPECIES: S8 family serine peptidase [Streptomyces]KAB8162854.1 S8 family serine peptidase [Streptomyces mimosae]KAB8179067.1 S8 family serine peptidase [Streptomyces sp. 3MP-14]
MNGALSWGLRDRGPEDIAVFAAAPAGITPEWAWGGSTGRGVRVCVVDSGVEGDHPMVGQVASSHAVVEGDDGTPRVVPTDADDPCGHGTACAGIVREVAPDCEVHSVRVLGENFSGSGAFLLAGLRWAVEQRFDVINLSLSTTHSRFVGALRELADTAYFDGTVLVASAHNLPVESFPWRFGTVFSVGSHQEADPEPHLYNPSPPVEFFAKGQDVRVAWTGRCVTRTTGNSFAAPRIAGRCAQILARHPGLTPFQLKTVLYLTAANVHPADARSAEAVTSPPSADRRTRHER